MLSVVAFVVAILYVQPDSLCLLQVLGLPLARRRMLFCGSYPLQSFRRVACILYLVFDDIGYVTFTPLDPPVDLGQDDTPLEEVSTSPS